MKTVEKQKIKSTKDWLIKFESLFLVKLGRFLSRLPDLVVLALLGLAQGIIRILRRGKTVGPLDDIKGIIQGDPEGNRAIRRIFLDSRIDQLKSLMEGVIKHQIKSEDANIVVVEESKPNRARDVSIAKVGLVGDDYEIGVMRREYERRSHWQVTHLKDFNDELLSAVDGLEIGRRTQINDELIFDALRRGVAVSIHHSALKSPEMVQKLYALSEEFCTPFRVFYPYIYYPPVQKIKAMLLEDSIGEVSTIRVRATIGGRGGAFEPEPPERETYFNHPAFDHFILLTYLGGPIEKIAAYLNPMDSASGGQGLVDFKYAHPCRYGLLDCTLAPQMQIQSQHYPYDLEAEIAGIDGIIWLRRGMAKRVQEAPIYVRVGRKSFHIGVESGISERWEDVYKNAAEHFVDMINGKSYHLIKKGEIMLAIKAKGKAYEANKSNKVVEL